MRERVKYEIKNIVGLFRAQRGASCLVFLSRVLQQEYLVRCRVSMAR